MQGLVSGGELLSFVVFLITIAGTAGGLVIYINGRLDRLRDGLESAAEKRQAAREAEFTKLWGEIAKVKDEYVKSTHLDDHIRRIERQLEGIGAKIDALVTAVARAAVRQD